MSDSGTHQSSGETETAAGEGAGRVLDAVARSPLASLLLVVVVAFAAILPGIFDIHPIDRDEARYAQATKQMLETGDYINIRFQDEERNKKPIGIHWLQAAAATVTGIAADAPIWVYRLPSLIGAVAAAGLTWWMALAFGRPRAALIAGLMVATAAVVCVEGRLATTDAVLLASIVASLGGLARAWLGGERPLGWGVAAIFWAGLAIGILVKGPVAPVLIALATIGLVLQAGSAGWLNRLRPRLGLIGLLVVVTPWFVAITVTAGGDFLSDALFGDILPKILSAQERHGAPPGTYLLLFFVTFWPAAAFYCLGLPWLLGQMRQPVFIFAFAAVVPFWLLFEALPTKLPHYVMPTYPALALLAATALDAGEVRARGWFGWLFSLGPLVMPAVVAIGAPVLFLILEGRVPVLATAVLIAGAFIGAWAWQMLRRDQAVHSFLMSVVAALVVYFGLFQLIVPELDQLRISGRLVADAHRTAICDEPALAAAGYSEPSLVFLAGTDIRLVDGAGAADFVGLPGCRMALVEKRRLPQFLERADDLGFKVVQRGEAKGFNISDGRRVAFGLYQRDTGGAGAGP